MTAVEAYEDCRRRYMEANWRKFEGEDSYKSYKEWLGKVPVFQEEFSTHVQALLRLHHTGDPEVMNALGDAFDMGLGVERDREKALEYLLEASRAGSTKAMVRLGGILKSPSKNQLDDALYWFRRAADGGNTAGMVSLGFAFRDGNGVPVDRVAAAEWFAKAVEGGHESAKILLAKVYYYYLKAPEKALPILLEEAAYKKSESYLVLGQIFSDPTSHLFDYDKALYWLKQVITDKSHSRNRARIIIAKMNLCGRHRPKDIAMAKEWLDLVVSDSLPKSDFYEWALQILRRIERENIQGKRSRKGVELNALWRSGDEESTIRISARDWKKIKQGEELEKRGWAYFENSRFSVTWKFKGSEVSISSVDRGCLFNEPLEKLRVT